MEEKEEEELKDATKEAEDFISLVSQLSEIYGFEEEKSDISRYSKMLHAFTDRFHSTPDYFCRAPGRVNLIGEHIDYCGYGVLPAALQQDMVIAVGKSSLPQIEVSHINTAQYPPFVITLPIHSSQKDIHFFQHDSPNLWFNYFIAAYRHVVQCFPEIQIYGFRILIDSNVPVAAGLSSSAAFSVSSTLVMIAMCGLRLQYGLKEMVPRIIQYERTVGVACGGMDQTISVFAKRNSAKFIEFYPEIRTTDVNIPKDAVLVIANSLTPSAKILTVGTRYNKRVVECRLALILISLHTKAIEKPTELGLKHFMDLQTHLQIGLTKMQELAEECILPSPYKRAGLEEVLGVKLEEVLSDIPNYEKVLGVSPEPEYFLYNRAMHVLKEAQRVEDFRLICEKEPDPLQLDQLGQLMNESHESCRDLYDCSSDNLEELIQLCR
jgi:N-acetylgalactosamine kinase